MVTDVEHRARSDLDHTVEGPVVAMQDLEGHPVIVATDGQDAEAEPIVVDPHQTTETGAGERLRSVAVGVGPGRISHGGCGRLRGRHR